MTVIELRLGTSAVAFKIGMDHYLLLVPWIEVRLVVSGLRLAKLPLNVPARRLV